MTGGTLLQALAYAARGWPVLPCLPGQKIPATLHGYQDATTDRQQIIGWFGRHPGWNLAIATGTPGPDVLDVDEHGPAGNGYAAIRTLRDAGLLDDASTYVQTPSGGMHVYFAGSQQHNGHLAAHHLDFRSAGGYVLAPPSVIEGRRYQVVRSPGGRGGFDWDAAVRLLEPQKHQQRSRQPESSGQDLTHLARWVASQPEGNRNAGLFWAANRALEADPAADLTPLRDAARLSGLGDLEVTRTLNSARKTGGARATTSDYQAEAGDHT